MPEDAGKSRNLMPHEEAFEDTAELMAVVLGTFLMAAPVMPGAATRMLVEGLRWVEDRRENTGSSQAERSFTVLARMFLEDHAGKMKQSGHTFYNKSIVKYLRRLTGWTREEEE